MTDYRFAPVPLVAGTGRGETRKDKPMTGTKYYLRRRWKISWAVVSLGKGRERIVKHYEHRERVGSPWQYVRGIRYERNTENERTKR